MHADHQTTTATALVELENVFVQNFSSFHLQNGAFGEKCLAKQLPELWTLKRSLFKVRFKVDLIVPQNEFVQSFKTQNNFFLQSILGRRRRYRTKLESDLQVYEFVTGLLWPIVLENFLSKITLQNWFCAFWLVKTFLAVNQSSSQWVYNLRWNFFRGQAYRVKLVHIRQ